MQIQIKLAPIQEDDIYFLEELINESTFKRFFVLDSAYRDDADAFLKYLIQSSEQETEMAWLIQAYIDYEWESTGLITCNFEEDNNEPYINYAMLSEYRGLGIATTAVGIIISSLQQWGIHMVKCKIYEGNFASETIVKKLNFYKNKIILFDNQTGIQHNLWHKWLQPVTQDMLESLKCSINADKSVLSSKHALAASMCQTHGLQPIIYARCAYFKARYLFCLEDYIGAEENLRASNKIAYDAGLGWDYENYYWLGRIEESQSSNEGAKYYYNCALENFRPGLSLLTHNELTNDINRVS